MKVGEFSLELINAETKEPMKEFVAPDGKVYVEAEPDLEYFIRCQRERGKGRASVRLEVDGTKLGYIHRFTTKTSDLGLWKRQNGTSIYSALKFVLKRTRGACGSSSDTTPIGSVNANFYETIFFGGEMVERKDSDKSNCLQQGGTSGGSIPVVASGAKKSFASVSGSAKSVSKEKRWSQKMKCGRLLGQMTIYYTSALGLSKLGILAPIAPAPAAAAAPDATNAAAEAASNNGNQGDEPVVAEPDPKRVKTERTEVKPEPAGGNDTVDLTRSTSTVAAAAASNDNAVIDLTGDDGILAPIAPAPGATNNASTDRNSDNQGDEPVVAEPDTKRNKTERPQIKPEPAGGNATVDFTGNTSNVAAAAASNDNAVVDLTGDDD